MRFGTAAHTSPGKIVPAGGAAVGAGPAGKTVTEVGVRVDSHASARIPKGQVVPTWMGGQEERKGMAAAAGGAGDGSTGDF